MRKSLIKTVRAHCIDCSGGQSSEVKSCQCKICNLYPYRMGRDPFRQKRVLSEAQKNQVRINLQKGRDNAKTSATSEDFELRMDVSGLS